MAENKGNGGTGNGGTTTAEAGTDQEDTDEEESTSKRRRVPEIKNVNDLSAYLSSLEVTETDGPQGRGYTKIGGFRALSPLYELEPHVLLSMRGAIDVALAWQVSEGIEGAQAATKIANEHNKNALNLMQRSSQFYKFLNFAIELDFSDASDPSELSDEDAVSVVNEFLRHQPKIQQNSWDEYAKANF